MTQDPSAKARELHAELVGVHGDDCASMCCEDIDRFLREADQRGFERGVKAAAKLVERRPMFKRVLNGRINSFGEPDYDVIEMDTSERLAAEIRQLLAPEREGPRRG